MSLCRAMLVHFLFACAEFLLGGLERDPERWRVEFSFCQRGHHSLWGRQQPRILHHPFWLGDFVTCSLKKEYFLPSTGNIKDGPLRLLNILGRSADIFYSPTPQRDALFMAGNAVPSTMDFEKHKILKYSFLHDREQFGLFIFINGLLKEHSIAGV